MYYGGSVMSSGGLPKGQIAGDIMNFGAHDTLCSGYLGDASPLYWHALQWYYLIRMG
jgi:hypothetical protein